MPEILRIPNLVSLSRIAMAPIICYFLSRDDWSGIIVSVILMAVAGISDGLDGYLARRMNLVGKLGIALDPIADKLFAACLVVCLIIHRDLPIWLAAIILGRDLAIVVGGLCLRGKRELALPSNLTGKYAFSAIVVLLVSYVVRFEFGIITATWITLVLTAASLVNYGRVFICVYRGEPVPLFHDRRILRYMRTILTWGYSTAYLVKLYLDVIR